MVWKSSKKRRQKRQARLRLKNQGYFYLIPSEILLCIANILDATSLVKLIMCCKDLKYKLEPIRISCISDSFGYTITCRHMQLVPPCTQSQGRTIDTVCDFFERVYGKSIPMYYGVASVYQLIKGPFLKYCFLRGRMLYGRIGNEIDNSHPNEEKRVAKAWVKTGKFMQIKRTITEQDLTSYWRI